MTATDALLAAAAHCLICGQPHPERTIPGLGRVFRTRAALDGHSPRPLDPAVLNSLRNLAAKMERPYPGAAAWFDATMSVMDPAAKGATQPTSAAKGAPAKGATGNPPPATPGEPQPPPPPHKTGPARQRPAKGATATTPQRPRRTTPKAQP